MDKESAPDWNCFVFPVRTFVPRFYFEWLVQKYSNNRRGKNPCGGFRFGLKQIQHTIQIHCLPDVKMVFRLCHVVQQKFQHNGAAQSPPLNLEIGKAHGGIHLPDVADADKAGIFHGFGEAVALPAAGGGADVFAVFPQGFAADRLIALPPLGAAEPAALIAQKFYFILLML